MLSRSLRALERLAREFGLRSEGSVASTFALTLIPIVTGVGVAVDYSRANAVKAFLQSALDAGLLAGAKDGSSNWMQVALNVFNSNVASKNILASTPTFTSDSNSTFTGSATASVPTSVLGIVRIQSLDVSVNATATMAEADNSCILTLDQGQARSHVSLTLNGAPLVNLSAARFDPIAALTATATTAASPNHLRAAQRLLAAVQSRMPPSSPTSTPRWRATSRPDVAARDLASPGRRTRSQPGQALSRST